MMIYVFLFVRSETATDKYPIWVCIHINAHNHKSEICCQFFSSDIYFISINKSKWVPDYTVSPIFVARVVPYAIPVRRPFPILL